MVAYKDGVGFDFGSSAAHSNTDSGKVFVTTQEFDFSKLNAARAAKGLPAFATGDSLDLVRIPKDTYVLGIIIYVEKTNATQGKVDIGYRSVRDGYIKDKDLVQAQSVTSMSETTGSERWGSYHVKEDAVSITFKGAIDETVLRLSVTMVDCS